MDTFSSRLRSTLRSCRLPTWNPRAPPISRSPWRPPLGSSRRGSRRGRRWRGQRRRARIEGLEPTLAAPQEVAIDPTPDLEPTGLAEEELPKPTLRRRCHLPELWRGVARGGGLLRQVRHAFPAASAVRVSAAGCGRADLQLMRWQQLQRRDLQPLRGPPARDRRLAPRREARAAGEKLRRAIGHGAIGGMGPYTVAIMVALLSAGFMRGPPRPMTGRLMKPRAAATTR